jgi:hypothetical protein
LSCSFQIAGIRCDIVSLLERTQRLPVSQIDARQVQRSAPIVTASGIELGTVICKCEQVPFKKSLETRLGGPHVHFCFGIPFLRSQCVS